MWADQASFLTPLGEGPGEVPGECHPIAEQFRRNGRFRLGDDQCFT